MREKLFRPVFFVLLITVSVCLVLSQSQTAGYPELLRQYAAAQQYYDQATNVSSREDYGPAEEALEKQLNEKALQGFAAVYEQTPRQINRFDSLRFFVCFKLGELHHYFEHFSNAVSFYREAISVKENSKLPDSLLFKPYLYAGLIFYNQNKFDTAAQFFRKAEAVQVQYGDRLSEAERLYNILGVLYYDRGNYRQAQNYIQKALSILPISHPYYKELSVNYKINLAQLHLRLEEYEKANAIYQELLPQKINLNEIHHNIGTLNLSLGAASKAIASFRKVAYQNNKVIRLYNSMGEAFFNLNQPDSALHYYRKAIASHDQLEQNGDKIGYGLTLKNLGDFRGKTGDHRQALRHYQTAIQQFYPSFQEDDVNANPQTFSGIFSYIHLFTALKSKADAWHAIYQSTGKTDDAKQELAAYQSAFALIGYVERTYDSDEARLFLAKTKHAVHGKPIDIAFELYTKTKEVSFLEELYYFDQQNKAAVLSLNRQLNGDISTSASPQLKKEQRIKEEITRLSIRAAQLTDSAQLADLQVRIRDQEIELSKLQKNLTQKATGRSSIPSILSLQKMLDDKTLLVSYHLTEEQLTVLTMSRQTINCRQQALPKDFTAIVQNAIARMTNPESGESNASDSLLYNLLCPENDLENYRHLIVIPDDVLAYFPFESLQRNGEYLIQKLAIQYQFSTALLEKNNTDFSGAKTVSFAPFAHESFGDSLPKLPASVEEIAAAEGEKLIDAAATKKQFLANSNRYEIVHLATHAVANRGTNGLSYIVFSPADKEEHLLYTQEIYNLNLANTNLLILSACETNAGDFAKGEGILSLSRAFAYAGCSNIITSLWKADDFSTAYLTSRMHRYLQDGSSVSEAVQKAKTDYLADEEIHPRLKKPYYWSHLVFIGNYQPAAKSLLPWIVAAIACAAVIALVFMRMKRRNF